MIFFGMLCILIVNVIVGLIVVYDAYVIANFFGKLCSVIANVIKIFNCNNCVLFIFLVVMVFFLLLFFDVVFIVVCLFGGVFAFVSWCVFGFGNSGVAYAYVFVFFSVVVVMF